MDQASSRRSGKYWNWWKYAMRGMLVSALARFIPCSTWWGRRASHPHLHSQKHYFPKSSGCWAWCSCPSYRPCPTVHWPHRSIRDLQPRVSRTYKFHLQYPPTQFCSCNLCWKEAQGRVIFVCVWLKGPELDLNTHFCQKSHRAPLTRRDPSSPCSGRTKWVWTRRSSPGPAWGGILSQDSFR